MNTGPVGGNSVELLYKFRAVTARALAILINRELYFARPADLNDPYEGVAPLVPAIRAAKRLVDQGELIPSTWLRVVLRLDPNHLSIGKKTLEQFSQLGVLSLSRADALKSPIMWAHYADNHRGFCLGFRLSDGFTRVSTREHDTGIIYCNPVTYGGRHPITDVMTTNNMPTDEFTDEFARALLASKSEAWKHEQEHRIVNHAPGTAKFDPGDLREVVFGARTSDEDERTIRNLLNGSDWKHVTFRRVRVEESSDDFRLGFVAQ